MKMPRKILQYPRLTLAYPKRPMDDARFEASAAIDPTRCSFCGECADRCPSRAIALDREARTIGIHQDQCVVCALCADVCPTGAATMTRRFELAEKDRRKLRASPVFVADGELPAEPLETTGGKVFDRIRRIYGRSLSIREVDSGSCNACDYEVNALNNPFNDLERFGFHFVASPRHADMLLVTGTCARNMEKALVRTYNATPAPRLVVAVGACACSGGIFRGSYATRAGIDGIVPVDCYVPGCPPRPQAILYGILKLLDRVGER